jgi:protein-L-isoaspartate O-methyltransferase
MDITDLMGKFFLNSTFLQIAGKPEIFTLNPLVSDNLYAESDTFNLYLVDRFMLPDSSKKLSDHFRKAFEMTEMDLKENLLEAIASIDRESFFQYQEDFRLYDPKSNAPFKENKNHPSISPINQMMMAYCAFENYDAPSIGIIGADNGYFHSMIANANPGKTVVFETDSSLLDRAAQTAFDDDSMIDDFVFLNKSNLSQVRTKYENQFDVLIFTSGIRRGFMNSLADLYRPHLEINQDGLEKKAFSGDVIAPLEKEALCNLFLGYDINGNEIINRNGCPTIMMLGRCKYDDCLDEHIMRSYDLVHSRYQGLFPKLLMERLEPVFKLKLE